MTQRPFFGNANLLRYLWIEFWFPSYDNSDKKVYHVRVPDIGQEHRRLPDLLQKYLS